LSVVALTVVSAWFLSGLNSLKVDHWSIRPVAASMFALTLIIAWPRTKKS
jgi:hypothetical protein